MLTLLRLDSSPLETSVSRALTDEFVAAWKAAHPDGVVIVRDLTLAPPPPVDAVWIGACFTPPPQRTAEQNDRLALSDAFLEELERADEYAIGVAMHNFSIPAVLKLWIDQVVRVGRTFAYSDGRPQGLLQGKKATILAATGGVYSAGTPAEGMNFLDPYLKTVLGFLGVRDIQVVTAGGTSQLRNPDVDRKAFLEPVLQRVRETAA